MPTGGDEEAVLARLGRSAMAAHDEVGQESRKPVGLRGRMPAHWECEPPASTRRSP